MVLRRESCYRKKENKTRNFIIDTPFYSLYYL